MRAGLIFLSVICAFMAFGCSRSADPIVAPVADPGVSRPVEAPRHVASGNRIIWGFWRIRISADRSTVEVVPDRSADLHVNTVRLLEDFPCKDCLVISGVKFNPPHDLSADLRLTHPYPGALKFTAFDVRGIFISGTGFSFPECGRMIAWGDTHPRMLNPDGYTPLFNPTEFPETLPAALGYIPGHRAPGGDLSANLNPFVAYSVGMPRRIFEAGSQQTRTVNLWVPDGPLEFGYAVDASWQLVEEVTDPLTDFPPDANCIEPYEITVEVGEGGAGVPICGDTLITAGIYDHQGLDTIGAVTIEAPDLFDGVVPLNYACDIGSEGWLYTATIYNELGAPDGVYPLVLKVDDLWVDPNLGEVDGWQVVEVNAIGQSTSEVAWARSWGGVENDEVLAVAAGNAGNILVAGFYMNVVDFDPGDGVVEHASTLNYSAPSPFYTADAFVSSFDASGGFQWVVVWGSDQTEWPFDVTVDDAGSIYVAGVFQGSVDFDPGPGTDVHSSTTALADAFLLKLDPSGNFLWARTWGGISADWAYAVATDDAGSVYVTGLFQFDVDFDPGPGQDIHVSSGGTDVYVVKLDSSGDFQWAHTWGGASVDSGSSVTTDDAGRVYVSGYFRETVDFDPGSGEDIRTANGDSDAFLSVFDIAGAYIEARTWGGGYVDDCDAVAIDDSGNSYVVGIYRRKVDLDPGVPEDIHVSKSWSGDAYLSKFDPSGNYLWGRSWGGVSTDYPLDVHVDADQNIYVTGYFNDTVDFDPGPGIDEHTSNGQDDAFLSKFDPSGNYLWAGTWGGVEDEPGLGVAVDSGGNAYVCGHYSVRVDFDPGEGYEIYCSNGMTDCYLSKFPPDGNW